MTPRTDTYPIKAPPAIRKRMAGCDQVHSSAAREALRSGDGRLVFGLARDMKWHRIERILFSKRGPTLPGVYQIVFADPAGYVRTFNKNGILLVEVPPLTHPADLTGD